MNHEEIIDEEEFYGWDFSGDDEDYQNYIREEVMEIRLEPMGNDCPFAGLWNS
ncbi:MAG: hypothetical protein KGI50_05420 [Patescibacteria group bacterium]|nr:hypothetical protein [Patescibacteria group bacterium]MDE2438755.1 hypothetical protein [Patescibacteria group bacterium]